MLIKAKGIGKFKEEYTSRQHGIEVVVACYRSGSRRPAVTEEQTRTGLRPCSNSNLKYTIPLSPQPCPSEYNRTE